MLRRLIGTIVVSFFVLTYSVPSYAEHAPCLTSAEFISAAMNDYVGVEVVGDFNAEESANIIQFYNRIPPITNYAPDHIIVLSAPQFRTMLLVAFKEDCYIFIDTQIQRQSFDTIYKWSNTPPGNAI